MDQTQDDDDDEVVLVLHALDESVKRHLLELVPEDDISEADNFIGGMEHSAFIKLTRDMLAKVLKFLGSHRQSVPSAKLVIGKDKIEMSSYSEEGIDKLLANPAIRRHLARIGEKSK